MSLALIDVRVWAGPEVGFAGEAIGFAGGRVLALGGRAEVLTQAGRECTVLEGGGRLLVPGFVDAHVHVRAAARAATSASCAGVRSAAELLALVRSAVGSGPLWLAGLEPALLADGVPARRELDAVSGAVPVLIRLRSLHGWVFNTAALAALRLGATAPDVVVDHGGLLRGRFAGDDVAPLVPKWSRARAREGVTALLDASVTNTGADVAWLAAAVTQRAAALTGMPAAGAAGLKLMPATGEDIRLREACSAAPRVAVHCANVETLGAIIAAAEGLPVDARRRVRIEHASVCPPDWLGRIADLGLAVVTHPAFVHAHGDRYLADPSLAPHEWLYRLRSWHEAGVRLAVGSDAPAGPVAPLLALTSALTRSTEGGQVLGASEALAPAVALSALTAWAADLSGIAGAGRLAPGGPGDAVLLRGDPFASANGLGVERVIVDGEPLVYPTARAIGGALAQIFALGPQQF